MNEYISKLCSILNIAEPAISYDSSFFLSDTMMACCDISSRTIYLRHSNQNQNPDPDTMFAIAHELRHLWQSTVKPQVIKQYRPVSELSILDYNLQLAELDANAFAGLVMISFFSLKPMFNNVPDKVKELIYQRMKLLSSNLYII